MSHELEAVAEIREASLAMIAHIDGLDLNHFREDRKSRSAVLYEIVIQGEAVKRLTLDLRGRYPSVPWSGMAGMRDRVVHSYKQVDLSIVWDVAYTIAPGLVPDLDRIIALESDP